VAISNHRIKAIDNETVTFTYKDYKDNSKVKLMTLTHEEFVRRFSQHILPKRFVRIRHYGILSSTWKRSKLADLQIKLGLTPVPKVVKVAKIQTCPCCKKGKMVTILAFDSRGPPEEYVQLLNLVPSPTV
jgi:Putative transposase